MVATVLLERGCKTIFEPLAGLLLEGAATIGFYDCHAPIDVTNFTTICVAAHEGHVDEPGKIGDGFPALPGAHLGIPSRFDLDNHPGRRTR